MTVRFADLAVGTALPKQTFPIERATLIRYAGASGDFNPIHWDERTATAVGLPDVIAHGMLTMAIAVRVVTDWLGDPGAVLDYKVRFTKPVVVASDGPTRTRGRGCGAFDGPLGPDRRDPADRVGAGPDRADQGAGPGQVGALMSTRYCPPGRPVLP